MSSLTSWLKTDQAYSQSKHEEVNKKEKYKYDKNESN